MNEPILKKFPYSKDEFEDFCITIDLLILNVCKNASKRYSSQQVIKIQKGYLTLKYPLVFIWEHYGFGVPEERLVNQLSLIYYEAFKTDVVNMTQELLLGIKNENPFNYYGEIANSNLIVEKLCVVYEHLLNNFKLQNIC